MFWKIKFTILLSVFVLVVLIWKQDVLAIIDPSSCLVGNDACSDKGYADKKSCTDSGGTDCDTKGQAAIKECLKLKAQCEGTPEVPEGSMLPTSLKDAGGRLYLLNIDKSMGSKPFEEIVGGYIKTGLALVGVIFLLLMVYGGYTWMIARGDETEATKAKDTITMASIGMAVVLIAYVITYFILSYALGSAGLGT